MRRCVHACEQKRAGGVTPKACALAAVVKGEGGGEAVLVVSEPDRLAGLQVDVRGIHRVQPGGGRIIGDRVRPQQRAREPDFEPCDTGGDSCTYMMRLGQVWGRILTGGWTFQQLDLDCKTRPK